MPTSRRARADERAQRVNAAVALLAAGYDVAEAARQLAGQHGLSERQARRYVERARQGGQVQVPQARVVFTVKLPADLARRTRSAAQVRRQTISALVTQALTEFLDRVHPRSGR
jgi:DNA-binding transcriptional regulator LsrR (DeoR family)